MVWYQTGKTPLIVATRAGQEEVAVALLAAGAKVKLADSAGKTALDYARAKKRHYLVEALTVRWRCVNLLPCARLTCSLPVAVSVTQKRATEEVDEASDVEEEIYLTKPDNAQDPQAGLRLPEVQAAMESSIPQLEKTLKGGGACAVLRGLPHRSCRCSLIPMRLRRRHCRVDDTGIHEEAGVQPAAQPWAHQPSFHGCHRRVPVPARESEEEVRERQRRA